MSFELQYYYLVEPAPQLIEMIRREVPDADFADVLLERLLIPKMHVAGHGMDDVNATQLKLAYLSMIRVDRVWDAPDQFQQLFGSSTLSAELFDRWWTLSEVDTELFEDLEKFVRDALPLIAESADPRVATWLGERATGAK